MYGMQGHANTYKLYDFCFGANAVVALTSNLIVHNDNIILVSPQTQDSWAGSHHIAIVLACAALFAGFACVYHIKNSTGVGATAPSPRRTGARYQYTSVSQEDEARRTEDRSVFWPE